MRAVPVPDGIPGRRVVIGESDPTRDDVRPCEYVVGASALFPGRPTFSVSVALDDDERKAIADGGLLLLTMDGGEVVWQIDAVQV